MTLTIRQRLEAQNAIYVNHRISALKALQQMHEHAVAALRALDEAEADMFDHPVGKVRLVPDYQPGVDPEHCAPGWIASDPAPPTENT